MTAEGTDFDDQLVPLPPAWPLRVSPMARLINPLDKREGFWARRWTCLSSQSLVGSPVEVFFEAHCLHPRSSFSQADGFYSEEVALSGRILTDAFKPQCVVTGLWPEVEQVEFVVGGCRRVEIDRASDFGSVYVRLVHAEVI